MVAIQTAHPDQAAVLQEIERLAGEQFRDIGMDEVADDEPASLDTLRGYAADGRSWVAVDDTGEVAGYTLVDVVDGCAHVDQISVLPDRQGRGIGRALVETVRAWAAQTGRRAVMLTTFDHVPWNRPLYEHLGFRVLNEAEIGPELRAVREAEAVHGLDPATRVCMRLELANQPSRARRGIAGVQRPFP